ncbi:MAG TPA: DUF1579 domain-containing protein [Tepidisphaeraceae bacterium]|jgi:hypothetical protein
MHELPAPQHTFLARLIGKWTSEMTASMVPGEPEYTSRGVERVRSLGGFWAVCEGEGNTPDGDTHRSLMTLGYDTARGRYVGTFVASMMSQLWLYDGTLDASGDVLTLSTEGPSFAEPGKIAPYRDVIAFEGDDRRTMTSYTPMPDGTWQAFMTARYRRVTA